MAIIKPVNPKLIKKWDKLYNGEGIPVEVLDHRVIAGRYEFSTFYKDEDGINVFKNYVYDSHDYDGEENPYPELYRKKPRR